MNNLQKEKCSKSVQNEFHVWINFKMLKPVICSLMACNVHSVNNSKNVNFFMNINIFLSFGFWGIFLKIEPHFIIGQKEWNRTWFTRKEQHLEVMGTIRAQGILYFGTLLQIF